MAINTAINNLLMPSSNRRRNNWLYRMWLQIEIACCLGSLQMVFIIQFTKTIREVTNYCAHSCFSFKSHLLEYTYLLLFHVANLLPLSVEEALELARSYDNREELKNVPSWAQDLPCSYVFIDNDVQLAAVVSSLSAYLDLVDISLALFRYFTLIPSRDNTG